MATPPGFPAADMPKLVLVGPRFMAPGEQRAVIEVPRDYGSDDRSHVVAENCTATNAVIAADYLISHAMSMSDGRPGYHPRVSREAMSSMITTLWPELRHHVWDLAKPGAKEPNRLLQSWMQEEIRLQVQEKFIAQQEVARQMGLRAAQDTIRRLWAIASEDNPSSRATALAAVAGEVRSVT